MTILVASLSTVLALALGWFVHDLAVMSSLRARAQIAADAAALAAVSESTPYGLGDHEQQARRFAELNGARLLRCDCGAGSTSARVAVAVGDVVAHARAVFDAALLGPDVPAFEHVGMNPVLAHSVERLVAAADGEVWVVSGYRSADEQRALWADALRRHGTPEAADDWVAPPGTSMHERGLAVDLGGDLALAVAIVDRMALPLHRPLPNEPWHFELVGARG